MQTVAKIKVMHVTFDMRIGGTEMVIKNIIEASDKEQFEMSIFCIEEPLGPWGVDMRNDGVPIDSVSRKDGFDFSVIRAIRKHIKANGIDVVHCHQYTPWVYGALAAFGLKTKVIFTEHGRFYPDSSSWKRRFVNPLLVAMTNAITAISEATKQALIDYEFISANRVEIIYNGINALQLTQSPTEVRNQFGINTSTVFLGTIARLDPIKNHIMMLKGLKICVDKGADVKLIIIGDGEMRPTIEALINELGLCKHVILPGYVSRPQNLLNAIDLYLLTSFSEGTSMTLLEAMSLGKPCIVTRVGGNPEVIEHNKNGMVVDSNQNKSLANEILHLVNNKQIRQSMGQESKIRFHRLFRADLMTSKYNSLYDL